MEFDSSHKSQQANADSIGEILYPLALLMDELKHDDVANRVAAMQRLDTIAIALGPERARNELLPFLFEVAHDDEDEVFSVLAEQLNGSFIPFIGGEEYATYLLPTLEFLAAIEEPIVRDKAIASLNDVADHMSLSQLNSELLIGINNLATADWFSSRVSSTGLFKSVISRVDINTRKELLYLYLKLIKDDAPMVRRAAATNLPSIIKSLEELEPNSTKHLDKDKYATLEPSNNNDWNLIFQMFKSLVNDDQDSVKFLSVDVLIAILTLFNTVKDDSTHNEQLLQDFIKLAEDESWRVRYMISEKFSDIVEHFNKNDLNDKILARFISLLKDNEAEVRKSISKQIPDFSQLIDQKNVIDKIIPQVEELVNDQNELVRSALASKVANLAPILGEKPSSEVLLNILLEMLNDEFPEVRLNIISNLTTVNNVIGINLLSKSLLPAITELAKDKQWRVRLAIIEYIPLLSKQLGIEFFNKVLNNLCMSWLWDSVYTIREAAVENLKKLAEVFGDKWAKEEIIDKILNNEILNDYKRENPDLFPELLNSNGNNADITANDDSEILEGSNIENVNNSIMNNFIYRITCLFTVIALVDVVQEDDIIINDILAYLNKLVSDNVPNIKFNVAKGYKKIAFRLLQLEKVEVKDDKLVINSDITNKDGENFEDEELNEVKDFKNSNYVSKLTTDADKSKIAKVITEVINPNLVDLSDDKDIDVQFFAKKSLSEIKLALEKIGVESA